MMNSQFCINCHFLISEEITTYGVDQLSLTIEQRKQIRENKEITDVDGMEIEDISCYFGVWDKNLLTQPHELHKAILEIDRHDFCFFWQYRYGMLIPAAETLQERETHNKETSKDRRYTIIGLWIAVIALVVNALCVLLRFGLDLLQASILPLRFPP